MVVALVVVVEEEGVVEGVVADLPKRAPDRGRSAGDLGRKGTAEVSVTRTKRMAMIVNMMTILTFGRVLVTR